MLMNFGTAAADYQRHRAGFPAWFFEKIPLTGRVLDLGSGTGTLALGYAAKGAQVTAVDISHDMLSHGGNYRKAVARAEALPFADQSFDAVVAGQCWHWFDGQKAAAECRRVLRPGGTLCIAHFDYLPIDGNAAALSEQLILKRNPSWRFAGQREWETPWREHVVTQGFTHIECTSALEMVPYSFADWRGRMRACNGVIGLPDSQLREEFDQELALELAAHFREPLQVPHRVWALTCRAPR